MIEKPHPNHILPRPYMTALFNTNVDACISKAKDIGANAFMYYVPWNKCYLKQCTNQDLGLIVDNTWGAGYTIYSDMFSCKNLKN